MLGTEQDADERIAFSAAEPGLGAPQVQRDRLLRRRPPAEQRVVGVMRSVEVRLLLCVLSRRARGRRRREELEDTELFGAMGEDVVPGVPAEKDRLSR